jgi:hypothetical protein
MPMRSNEIVKLCFEEPKGTEIARINQNIYLWLIEKFLKHAITTNRCLKNVNNT